MPSRDSKWTGDKIPPKPRILQDKENKNTWRIVSPDGSQGYSSGSWEDCMEWSKHWINRRKEFLRKLQERGKFS